MNSSDKDAAIQRDYYAQTANLYDEMHTSSIDEHYFALSVLIGLLDFLEIRSILDVGSGTGRALLAIKKQRPNILVRGVEPVAALREIGYKKGLLPAELIDGDALNLQMENESFDLVCEFGVLHHVRRPELVVAEMLRVSKKAIFISDSNNFGQGGRAGRAIKQLINGLGWWRYFDLIKTRGRGYSISEGDGLAYSYSVFNNYAQVSEVCDTHLINTLPAGSNIYKSAPQVALLGIKKHDSYKSANRS